MVKLCKEADVDLILTMNYVNSFKAHHLAAKALAKKYNVKYLNINEFIVKTGFQHNLDLRDSIHFNLSGAIKWTHYLGEYLKNNYNFTDKRKDKSYQRYEEQRNILAEQKKFIYTKQSLLSVSSFYKYLKALNEIDLKENIICISINDDAMNHLSKVESDLLHDLGLNIDLKNKNGCSYAAVISSEGVQEKYSFLNTVTLDGNINETSYEITSNGLQSSGSSSIIINDTETIQNGKGFNFTIYNTKFDKITNSCFFDTSTSVNPPQSRYKTTAVTNIQQITEPNIWENLE